MKWREPWREMLKRQPPLRLLSRENLWNGLLCTAVFVGLFLFGVVSGKSSLSEGDERFWWMPVFGFGIAGLLAVAHWLSPLEVSSGPSGIVRSKGDALTLIPWSTIRSYRFRGSGAERVLELEVSYSAQPERLYLSSKVDIAAVEAEIRANVRAAARPFP